MELRHLRYFVAIADTLSFSRASESLYVSQSALSKQIAELERELGVLLFQRDKRSVALTEAGRLLLPEAKNILIQSEKLVPLLRKGGQPGAASRSVYIGVEARADEEPAVHTLLSDAVFRQRQQVPGLRTLYWRTDYLSVRKALLEGTYDLGVFLHTEPTLGEEFDTLPLMEDELVLVVRSQYPYPNTLDSVQDLLQRRGIILLERESRGQTQILNLLAALNSAPQIRFCGSPSALRLTVESGESTAILPATIARQMNQRDLQQLSLRNPMAKIWYLLARSKSGSNENAIQVYDWIQEQLNPQK